jgi:hypothetical protein
MKKVRRHWNTRQQKAGAFEKGDSDALATDAGTKDSTDAAQRVPTFPCGAPLPAGAGDSIGYQRMVWIRLFQGHSSGSFTSPALTGFCCM